MKKLSVIIPIVVVLLLVIGVWYGIYNGIENPLGGSFLLNEKVLMGSSSNFISAPKSMVEGNSTTTDSGTVEDPGTITQFIGTEGIETGLLAIKGVGGTASSTLYWVQTCSTDDTNFFDISSTTPAFTNSTTTLGLGRQGYQIDLGTATTTGKNFPVNVKGCKSVRFQFWGDDLSTDPNDGVQAWIKWIPQDKIR